MRRSTASRKGENGSVAVIGGSYRMHGAPIFAALAAQASGVDLVFPYIPRCHAAVTKNASYNFIVSHFSGDDIHECDVGNIVASLPDNGIGIIGPGLAVSEEAQNAMPQIIRQAEIPLVIDASALQPWTLEIAKDKTAILTPHMGELGRMIGKDLSKKDFKYLKTLTKDIAKEYGVTIILKGPVDLAAGNGGITEIEGGNAGLTVGGTGDSLAGLIAGLAAQGISPFEACCAAATIIKRAATVLYRYKGYSFTTMDVIEQIPHLLHTYDI